MTFDLRRTALGVLLAVGITTAMDSSGLSAFSALPLLPLMALFWYMERFSRGSMGFVRGKRSDYGLAMLHPLIVLGFLVIVSVGVGAVDTSHTSWGGAWRNFAGMVVATCLIAVLTEEGFFRGWLFASLEDKGLKPDRALLWSSAAFALWHLSAVLLPTGFELPRAQIPLFIVNAGLMGAIWGLMRSISGSVIVSSISHGVWNAGAYVFFGFGTKVGALGIENTAVYGPEVGILGLVLNLAFAFALWRRWKTRTPSTHVETAEARSERASPASP